jgi:ABC-type transport system involved in Fe-S cluster assembly fused permease/ATPase subunit
VSGRSERVRLPKDGLRQIPVPPFRQQLHVLGELLPHLWPAGAPGLRARTVAAILLILAAKAATVLVPFLFKRAVDALGGGRHASVALVAVAVPVALIAAYGAARILAQLLGELRELVFAPVSHRAVRLVSLKVFRHLHRLSLRFHLERQTGGLTRAVERGTASIDYLSTFLLFNIGPTLIEIALVATILWRIYSASFALVSLATVLAYAGFTIGVTQWRVRFRHEMNDRDAEANAKMVDSLLNYETVKYFANETHEAARYEESKEAFQHAALKSQSTLSLLNIGQGVIISLGLVVVLLMAGSGVASGRMTLGDFVLVNSYLLQLYQPLTQLGSVYRNVKQSLIDVEAMYALLRAPAEVADRPGAKDLAVTRGAVAFEHVDFAYDARRAILKDVSFEVPPGKTLAIVGATGSGKSTVARLLFRFYDVGAGAIRIDGQDLRDVTQDSVRRAIGVVPQDTVLFNDTILYNIAYGRPEASLAEIEEAARLAHIHDFIRSLPEGYESRVGERGLKLSGGEKQRVAIARVILKRPRILIFDEATSALDTHTEREIQASLREVSAERTTLVIAHRLSTIVDADEILVLEAGRVVERGRHGELLRQGGAYASLWQRQLQAATRPVPV